MIDLQSEGKQREGGEKKKRRRFEDSDKSSDESDYESVEVDSDDSSDYDCKPFSDQYECCFFLS